MSELIRYCKKWFIMKKIAIDPLSEAQALEMHVSGGSNTALVEGGDYPACFIECLLDKKMIGVGFLDVRGREYLTYQFRILSGTQLFLSMATYREFDRESDRVLSGDSYIFKEKGELYIRHSHMSPHALEEAQSTFDPAGNYEAFPAFGDYSSLTKVER
jgi:hypothetical protein